LKQKQPSRRKFCFIAIKILFHRDETKIVSFIRGKSAAVNRPRTGGIGRTSVGGYVGKLYLFDFSPCGRRTRLIIIYYFNLALQEEPIGQRPKGLKFN